MIRLPATILALVMCAGAPALHAQELPRERVPLFGSDGAPVGEALLQETPALGVLISVELKGIEPGTHAIHIHETGRCETPSFQSAGGHYAPRDHAHGFLHPDGAHAGDLVNLHVPEDGSVQVERHARDVTLRPDVSNTLFDSDGSAIVVHAGSDDYRSQPSGDAGDRIACGTIR